MKFSQPGHTRRDKFHRQLRFLRSIVPSREKSVTVTGWSSVLSDAANYIEEMRKQIRELSSDIQEPTLTTLSAMPADLGYLNLDDSQAGRMRSQSNGVHVEVLEKEEGLEIHISCEKRAGLLIEVMEVLEGFGLIFVKVNIQCNNRLQFDVFGAQSCEGRAIEAEVVRNVLLRTIVKTSDGA